MGHYRTVGPVFDNFPNAIEAINLTFQRYYAQGEDYATKKSGGWASTKATVGNPKLMLDQMERHSMFCLPIQVHFTI